MDFVRSSLIALTTLALFSPLAASTARAEEGDESPAPAATEEAPAAEEAAAPPAEDAQKPAKPGAPAAATKKKAGPAPQVPVDDPPVLKVIRVKKKTAVVVFSKNHGPLKKGMRGRFVPMTGKDDVDVEGPSRTRFIGIDSNFEMLDTKTDPGGGKGSSKSFNANLTYGWNKERFEYGVTLSYQFGTSKVGTTESDNRTILLGGLFDFNFKPNNLEREFVLAARLTAGYGQIDQSAYKAAGSTWQIEPGVVAKWFGLSPNLGATGFLGYRMRNDTIDTAKTAVSGIVGRIGIQAYF